MCPSSPTTMAMAVAVLVFASTDGALSTTAAPAGKSAPAASSLPLKAPSWRVMRCLLDIKPPACCWELVPAGQSGQTALFARATASPSTQGVIKRVCSGSDRHLRRVVWSCWLVAGAVRARVPSAAPVETFKQDTPMNYTYGGFQECQGCTQGDKCSEDRQFSVGDFSVARCAALCCTLQGQGARLLGGAACVAFSYHTHNHRCEFFSSCDTPVAAKPVVSSQTPRACSRCCALCAVCWLAAGRHFAWSPRGFAA